MKILLTSDWGTSVWNFRKGLEERGHEVRILTLSQTRHCYAEGGVTYIANVFAFLSRGLSLSHESAYHTLENIRVFLQRKEFRHRGAASAVLELPVHHALGEL